jgi:hypothetical protein
MPRKLIAVIRRETRVNTRTRNKSYHASLSLEDARGNELGLPRYFANYGEVADLLIREAGVTYEQLNDRAPLYDKDRAVKIHIRVDDKAIKLLAGCGKIVLSQQFLGWFESFGGFEASEA